MSYQPILSYEGGGVKWNEEQAVYLAGWTAWMNRQMDEWTDG